jgi:dTMP kinase
VLIAFEGGEGAGKSSHSALLAEAIRATGRTVVVTHEPGATALGQQVRRLLLDSAEPISPRAEALLFAADRAQHVAGVIRPALDRGEVVITDRFVDSSLAYQGAGRRLAVEEIKRLSRWAAEDLVADLTVLLDVPVELGLARARQQPAATGLDRLEREALDFHDRVRAGFRSLAESDPNRYLVLDASRPLQDLAAVISARVLAVLPPGRPGSAAPAEGGPRAEDGGPALQRGSHDVAEAPK